MALLPVLKITGSLAMFVFHASRAATVIKLHSQVSYLKEKKKTKITSVMFLASASLNLRMRIPQIMSTSN